MENSGNHLDEILQNVLLQNDTIFIVSHNGPDMDAIGSSIGMASICKKYKKNAYLVIDNDINEIEICTKLAIEDITSDDAKRDNSFIDVIKSSEIRNKLGKTNALIVLDASKEKLICINPYDKIFNDLIIIDHHEKSDDTINAGYKYIDSSKSSTCEIITELIHSLKVKIKSEYATYILAGLSVDTNGYHRSVTPRTFEIIGILMRMGAEEDKVQKLLVERDKERAKIRSKLIHDNTITLDMSYQFAISSENDDINKTIFLKEDLAKVANELLKFGVNASFAIGYLSNNGIYISARSDGSVNIDKIMKSFNGGGSEYQGAAMVLDSSLNEINQKLKQILYPYYMVEKKEKIYAKTKKLELTI